MPLPLPPHRPLLTLILALAAITPARPQTPAAPNEPSSDMQKDPATETEEETDPNALTINLEIDTRSRYVFRGVPLSEGLVVQPTLTLAKRGYTFSVFSNVNASRRSGLLQGPRQLNEVDYTLTKTLERGKVTIEPGFVYYDYPTNLFANTGELSLGLSRPLGSARLFLNNNVDVLEYKGAYFGELGVSQERPFGQRTTGEATLSLGFANGKFNAANFGPTKRALNVLNLGTALTYQINPKLYLRPHLNYTRIIDSGLRGAVNEPNVLEGGVAVGLDF